MISRNFALSPYIPPLPHDQRQKHNRQPPVILHRADVARIRPVCAALVAHRAVEAGVDQSRMDSLRTLDLTQRHLDEATRQLLQRLLNHLETLEAELQTLREENQQRRDDSARLKGQKPKPQFKANQPAAEVSGTTARSSASAAKPKPSPGRRVPRAERIKIDRAQGMPLERSQLPPDFQSAGYRAVVSQNC
jgi:hypothetical protein